MAAPTVFENVAEDANVQGGLFAGKKFWVAQRVPMRKTFLEDIKNNGGEVVMLEKHADYMIADHFRRDCPPGSISYRFIGESLKKGEIQDPENHLAGPPVGTARAAGSAARPTKGGRAAYTVEEDIILYKWVRDCEAQGGLASGNEIYKQLEAKHPRHTWQSWRDRYLKQLRDRPPSAFNIPDNAPPSPPSDEPVRPVPATTVKKEKGDVPKKEDASSNRFGESGRARNTDYTVDDFDRLFDKDDWEQLYANVAEIKSCSRDRYAEAWKSWAEGRTQTADQWKQYFEKVVMPQWERDPVWKREKVKKEFEIKQQETASQKASQATQEPEDVEETSELAAASAPPRDKGAEYKKIRSTSEDARFDHFLEHRRKGKSPSAYFQYAREKKWSVWNEKPGLNYTELHTVLMAQWDKLSAEEKAPYFALEAAEDSRNEGETTRESPQVCLSSSTAVHETPKYIAEAYEKALKRIHEGNYAELAEEHVETPRPAKRRKSRSASPKPQESIEEVLVGASQLQPLEISSDASSTSESELPQDGDMADAPQLQAINNAKFEDSESDFDALEAIRPKDLELGSSDYPSNTPTPRARRHKAPVFDTQAILSSPSQGFALEALPLPRGFSQIIEEDEEEEEDDDDEGQQEDELPAESPIFEPHSPSREPESEASTTHSLQEFRRSLTTAEENSVPLHSLAPLTLPHTLHSSPPPSSPKSSDELDPDPPLQDDEFDQFYAEQHAAGYTDDFISAALKHTRFRPELAEDVLAAWEKGKPLPDVRGVWSKEDDEDVESGDGRAMARLQRKHTCDGWGGMTERMKYLEVYRGRNGE